MVTSAGTPFRNRSSVTEESRYSYPAPASEGGVSEAEREGVCVCNAPIGKRRDFEVRRRVSEVFVLDFGEHFSREDKQHCAK